LKRKTGKKIAANASCLAASIATSGTRTKPLVERRRLGERNKEKSKPVSKEPGQRNRGKKSVGTELL